MSTENDQFVHNNQPSPSKKQIAERKMAPLKSRINNESCKQTKANGRLLFIILLLKQQLPLKCSTVYFMAGENEKDGPSNNPKPVQVLNGHTLEIGFGKKNKKQVMEEVATIEVKAK